MPIKIHDAKYQWSHVQSALREIFVCDALEKTPLGVTSSSATDRVTLSKLLDLSETQFLLLENGENDNLPIGIDG